MPAIATVGCMFILLTCHRLGGGGGGDKRKEGKGGEEAECLCANCDLQRYGTIQPEMPPFIQNISGSMLICIP